MKNYTANRHRQALTLVALIASAAVSLPAKAQPLWGTETSVRVADVHTGSGQDNQTFASGGGPGIWGNQSLIDDAVSLDSFGNGPHDRGITQAYSSLRFNNGQVPALRARSILTGNTSGRAGVNGAVVGASAFASELFQYVGVSPATLTLTFTLEGEVFDPVPEPLFDGTDIHAPVAVFETTNYDFIDDLSTLIFEQGAIPKALDDTTLVIEDDTNGAAIVLTTELAFDVEPDEQFYVWAELQTGAFRGTRFADAFGTLTAEFDQPDLVVPLSVPEPSTCALLLLAAIGPCARSRERHGLP